MHKNLNILFSDPSRLRTDRKHSEASASVYCQSGSIAISTNENYIYSQIF